MGESGARAPYDAGSDHAGRLRRLVGEGAGGDEEVLEGLCALGHWGASEVAAYAAVRLRMRLRVASEPYYAYQRLRKARELVQEAGGEERADPDGAGRRRQYFVDRSRGEEIAMSSAMRKSFGMSQVEALLAQQQDMVYDEENALADEAARAREGGGTELCDEFLVSDEEVSADVIAYLLQLPAGFRDVPGRLDLHKLAGDLRQLRSLRKAFDAGAMSEEGVKEARSLHSRLEDPSHYAAKAGRGRGVEFPTRWGDFLI